MTDQQIKEQIQAIEKVTREVTASKEKAAAFLRSAGITSTPVTNNHSGTSAGLKK
jgi:hypothetical protein